MKEALEHKHEHTFILEKYYETKKRAAEQTKAEDITLETAKLSKIIDVCSV